jgi:hypothetical protein
MDVISGHLLNIFDRMSEAMFDDRMCAHFRRPPASKERVGRDQPALRWSWAHIRSSNIASEFAMIRLATYGRRHRSTV